MYSNKMDIIHPLSWSCQSNLHLRSAMKTPTHHKMALIQHTLVQTLGTSSQLARQNHKMKAKRGFERFLKRSRLELGRPNKRAAHPIHSGLTKNMSKHLCVAFYFRIQFVHNNANTMHCLTKKLSILAFSLIKHPFS